MSSISSLAERDRREKRYNELYGELTRWNSSRHHLGVEAVERLRQALQSGLNAELAAQIVAEYDENLDECERIIFEMRRLDGDEAG